MSKTAKKTKKSRAFLIPLILCVLVAAAAVWFVCSYTLVGGRVISVSATEVDLRDAGVSSVSGLSRCKNLQSADLRGNDLDPEEVSALEAKLPDCFIRWDIPLGDGAYDSETEDLNLTDIPENWSNITLFKNLKTVTVAQCSDAEKADEMVKALPNVSVRCYLPLAGQYYSYDITTAVIKSQDAKNTDLAEELSHFTKLESLTVEGDALPIETIRAVIEACPNVKFSLSVPVGDIDLPQNVTELPYEGKMPDVKDLESVLDLLTELKKVDFSDTDTSADDRVAFRAAHPELEVTWTVTLNGTVYPNDTTELDLTGVQFSDTTELEEAIAQLPDLVKVDLTDCGLDNETLYDLNQKFENVEIVWTLYFKNYTLRTDATYFIPSSTENLGGLPLVDGDLDILKYCPNMEGLDLGHQYFEDLSFLYYTPKLKYLILAECPIRDITPIGSLTELKYAELFDTYIDDISPLVNCTKLDSLNLSYTYVLEDNAWNALSQMTWLRRLWWCNIPLSGEEISQLQANGTTVFCIHGGEPTGGTWRYDDAYYEMRDFFGNMWYMPGGTNGLDEDGNQIVVDDHGNEFHLENWDLTQRWWELPQFAGMDIYIQGITDQ